MDVSQLRNRVVSELKESGAVEDVRATLRARLLGRLKLEEGGKLNGWRAEEDVDQMAGAVVLDFLRATGAEAASTVLVPELRARGWDVGSVSRGSLLGGLKGLNGWLGSKGCGDTPLLVSLLRFGDLERVSSDLVERKEEEVSVGFSAGEVSARISRAVREAESRVRVEESAKRARAHSLLEDRIRAECGAEARVLCAEARREGLQQERWRLESMERRLGEVLGEVEMWKGKVRDLERGKREEEEVEEGLEKERKRVMEKVLKEREEGLEKERRSLERMRSVVEEERRLMEREKEYLEMEIAKRVDQKTRLVDERASVRERECDRKLDLVKQDVEWMERALKAETQCDELQGQVDRMQVVVAKVDHLERESSEIRQKLEEAQSLIDAERQLRIEAQIQTATTTSRESQLRSRLEELERSNQALSKSLETAKSSELHIRQTSEHFLEQTLRSLESDLRASHTKETTRLRHTIESLSSSVRSKDSKLQNLQKRYRTLESLLAAERRERERAELRNTQKTTSILSDGGDFPPASISSALPPPLSIDPSLAADRARRKKRLERLMSTLETSITSSTQHQHTANPAIVAWSAGPSSIALQEEEEEQEQDRSSGKFPPQHPPRSYASVLVSNPEQTKSFEREDPTKQSTTFLGVAAPEQSETTKQSTTFSGVSPPKQSDPTKQSTKKSSSPPPPSSLAVDTSSSPPPSSSLQRSHSGRRLLESPSYPSSDNQMQHRSLSGSHSGTGFGVGFAHSPTPHQAETPFSAASSNQQEYSPFSAAPEHRKPSVEDKEDAGDLTQESIHDDDEEEEEEVERVNSNLETDPPKKLNDFVEEDDSNSKSSPEKPKQSDDDHFEAGSDSQSKSSPEKPENDLRPHSSFHSDERTEEHLAVVEQLRSQAAVIEAGGTAVDREEEQVPNNEERNSREENDTASGELSADDWF